MGKGGGSQQPTTSQVNQSNLPEYARPYFEDLMQRGQTASQVQYQPYGGERTAGFTPMQEQGFQGVQNLGPSSLNAPAAGMTTAAGIGGLSAGQYQSMAPQQTYQGSQFQNMGLGYKNVNSQNFGQQSAQNYMSPYAQQAIDPTLRENQRQFDVASAGRQAAATRSGAFGGSRQAIEQSEAQRNLGRLQSDTQAQGMQAAYQNAQQQFNADQARGMQADLANQGAYGQAQGLGLQQNLASNQQDMQNAQLRAQYGMAGLQAGEQSRQFGANLGLQGLGLAGQMGQQLGQLGQTAFGQEAAAAQAQQTAGATQQAQSQDILNRRYEDFMQQQTFPQSQLQNYSALLRGVPVSPNQTMYQYQAPASGISQLAGLGMGAYGMSQAFKKDGGVVQGYAEGGPTGGIAGGPEGQPTTLEVSKIKTALLKGADPRSFPPSIALLLAISDPRVKDAIDTREGAKVQAALDQGRQNAQLPSIMEEQMAQLEPSGGIAGLDMGAMETAEYDGGGIIAFKDGDEVPSGQRQFDITDPFGVLSGLKGLYNRPRSYATPEEEDRARRLETLAQTRVPAPVGLPAVPAGIVASISSPAGSADQLQGRPADRPEDFARPAAAPTAAPKPAEARTAAPATTATAPVTSKAGAGMIPLQDVDKKEREYRDYMGKKYSSELKTRLDEVKEQTASAVKERDADRWMALALGGFSMAANAKPGARGLTGFLGDLGAGLQLTTKELVGVNKEFRKGQALRTAAEREERKADRLEQMGLDDKAYQVRLKAEKFNLDAQKANQSLTATLEQTDAYKKVNTARIASERDTRAVIQSGRAADKATAEKANKDAGILGQQRYVEKQLEPYNTRLAELELLIAQGAFEVKVPNGKTMPIAELITRVKAQRKTKRDEVLSERGMSGPGGSLTPGAGGVLQYTPPS
jgi:hypothetical protein